MRAHARLDTRIFVSARYSRAIHLPRPHTTHPTVTNTPQKRTRTRTRTQTQATGKLQLQLEARGRRAPLAIGAVGQRRKRPSEPAHTPPICTGSVSGSGIVFFVVFVCELFHFHFHTKLTRNICKTPLRHPKHGSSRSSPRGGVLAPPPLGICCCYALCYGECPRCLGATLPPPGICCCYAVGSARAASWYPPVSAADKPFLQVSKSRVLTCVGPLGGLTLTPEPIQGTPERYVAFRIQIRPAHVQGRLLIMRFVG